MDTLLAESPEELRARQKMELKEFNKRATKRRSFVPKKDREGKQRVNQEIELELEQLKSKHKEERNVLGLETDDEGQPQTQSQNNKDQDQNQNQSQNQNNSEQDKKPPATINETFYGNQNLSKKQKKKLAKEQEEKEKALANEMEKNSLGPSQAEIESQKIKDILTPLNLKIHPIKADGDCLYSSIGDQLYRNGATDSLLTPSQVRSITADYLVSNPDDFLPFIESVDLDEQKFLLYCDKIRHTKTWGGHVELKALSEMYKVKIDIYSSDVKITSIGEDFANNPHSPLRLSYHRKLYGLGEHYNSVIQA